MPCLMPLLWLLSLVILWVGVIHGFQELPRETDPDRRATAAVTFLLVPLPPTLVFLVSAGVLLVASPTVQFNVGSSLAMSLWSFWVESWRGIFGCSEVQAVGYLIWAVALFATKPRRWLRHVVVWGLISSLIGSFVLSMASPSA
jgi:hypothetical protein